MTLAWNRFAVPGGRQIRVESRGIEATTDGQGRFRACGIPPNVLVTATASYLDWEGEPRELEARRTQILVLELTIQPGGLTP